MQTTPRGLRVHIAIFGRRNVGKSSLLNAITRQAVSIVSDVAGTTTDPVEKPMELLPIGPVVFIDTAGIDDEGALGAMRVARTREVFARTDIALIVVGAQGWSAFEDGLVAGLADGKRAVVAVLNQCDRVAHDAALAERLRTRGLAVVRTSALTGDGIGDLRQALVKAVPEDLLDPPAVVADLVPPGELAVLVVPIDLEAPKGRLIMPQVQTIRDLLDGDAMSLVVKERELRAAIANLRKPPALVVTDSQAFLRVAADVPDSVPLTSFSILFARFKGDLPTFARGAMAIDRLKPGDKVLICEACTHHPIGEDIGRVKIPRWLTQYVGGKLEIVHACGRDFPADIGDYRLVVHCGSCTFNRRQLLSRLIACEQAGVPITNYGMAIAWSLGIFPRALRPFPSALAAAGLEPAAAR